ncbi:hypothetical protein ACWGQ9_25475 [Streptomyces parvus]
MRLRTSHPSGPGYRRIKQGRAFRFVDAAGLRITDEQDRRRVRELVIPPAWREVWICPWPSGHVQAVGTDDAGRRQYLYHPQFRPQQEQAKHDRVLEVAVAGGAWCGTSAAGGSPASGYWHWGRGWWTSASSA